MTPPPASRRLENALRRRGFVHVAGVDEVGRGCLAGPVMAAAVILPADLHVPGLRDSKQLNAAQREKLHDVIVQVAVSWAVARAEPSEIDLFNIHRASLRCMRSAVEQLQPSPSFVLTDAFAIPGLAFPQRGLIRGDARVAAIAAASIVAKVIRDRVMMELDAEDPRYGFALHKGYATAAHLEAVARYGYSAVHRRTFRQPTLFDTIDDRH